MIGIVSLFWRQSEVLDTPLVKKERSDSRKSDGAKLVGGKL